MFKIKWMRAIVHHRAYRGTPLRTILIVIILLGLGLFIHAKTANASWYNENWLYRKAISVANTGMLQTDFQVSFTLNTSSTDANGLIKLGKMKADCSDLRVTDGSGNIIPYWIEENNPGCDSTTTKIWAKVPSAFLTGATIYAYYGNPSATDASSPSKVFEFFDDFTEGSVDSQNRWNSSGNPTVTAGALSLSNGAKLASKNPLSNTDGTRVLGMRAKVSSTALSLAKLGFSDTNTLSSSFDSNDTAAVMVGSEQAYHTFIDGANMVSYHQLEETTSTDANQFKPSGYLDSGKLNQAVSMYGNAAGTQGSTLTFNRGAQISGNNYEHINGNQGTISLWYKPNWNSTPTHGINLLTGQYGGGTRINILTSGVVDICHWLSGTQVCAFSTAITNWSPSSWYHIVGKWNANNPVSGSSYMTISVNGTEYTSSAPTSAFTVGAPGVFQSICGYVSNTYPACDGLIDDFAIFDRPLSTTEITSLYNSGTGNTADSVADSSLKFYAKLDGTGTLSPVTYNGGASASKMTRTSTELTGGTNLITNGGFETNTASWTAQDTDITLSRSTSTVIYDTGSLSVANTNVTTTKGGYQAFSTTNGSTYHFEGWVQPSASGVQSIQITNNAGVNLVSYNSVGTGWQKFATDFVANDTTMKVWLNAGNGTAYFDNITLTPNLVNNGGMEGTYSSGVAPGWTSQTGGTATFSESATSHSGSKSQSITSANSWTSLYQNFTPVSGNWYLASAWVRSDTSGKTTYLTYYDGTTSYNSPTLTFTGANTWYRLSFIFKGTSAGFVKVSSGDSGHIWLVDDYSVIPLDNTALSFKSWTPVSEFSSNNNQLSIQGNLTGVSSTTGKYSNGYTFDGSTGYLRQKTYAVNIGDLSYSGNTLTDTGQTFTSYKTSSGNASYMLVVTNSDNTTSWGYIGNNSEAATAVTVYTTIGRATAGWLGTSPTGKTPVGYEIRKTDYQITGNMTAGIWVKTSNTNKRLLDKGIDSSNGAWSVDMSPTGKGRFVMYWGGDIDGTTTINDNSWHFIVGVYDGTYARAYIDGVQENYSAQSAPTDVVTPVMIGYNGISGYFAGSLDSPFVLNRALTADQIKALYNVGTPKYGLANSHTSLSGFGDGSSYSVDTNYHTFEITQKSSSVDYSVDGGSAVTSPTNPPSSNEYLRLENSDTTNTVSLDYLYVRKTYSTQPTSSVSGTEEQGPGPVGYWSFDEGQGTLAQDKSSSNNDGTISGATWQTEDQCISGKCLGFDGSTGYVTVNDSPAIRPSSAMSISAWVRLDSAQSNNKAIASKRTGFNNNDAFVLWRRGSDGKASFGITTTGTDETVAFSTTVLNPNQWYHLTGLYDGSQIKIYVNGILEGTTNKTGNIYQSTANLAIGSGSGSSASETWPGRIDEVKIYPYARSSTQIRTDYLAGQSKAGSSARIGSKQSKALSDGLVGYWKMDETSGTSVTDSSGNSNTGTLTNAQEIGTAQTGGSTTTILDGANSSLSSTDSVYNGMIVNITGGTCGEAVGTQRTISSYTGASKTITVSSAFGHVTDGCTYQILHQVGGKYGNGLAFGSDTNQSTREYINVNNSSSLNPGTSDFTITAWQKYGDFTSRMTMGKGHTVWMTGGSNLGTYQVGISSANTATINLGSSTTNLGPFITLNQTLQTNTWYLITWVFNRKNNLLIYINGQLAATYDISSLSSVSLSNTYPLYIGLWGGAYNAFYGNMDEVRVYNRALSPQEVSDLYNWAPGPIGYWKMDDKVSGNSKTLVDSSGYGNNGTTYYGANTTGMDCTKVGKYGGACSFDGTDDYVDLGNKAAYKPGLGSFTVMAWVKSTVNQSKRIVTIRESTSPVRTSYDIYSTSDVYRFDVADGTNAVTPVESGISASDGKWHHITGVIDRNSNLAILYVDGVNQASSSISGFGAISPNANLLIGNFSTSWWSGQIDDVKIYNYARTQKQIVSDMNGGHPAVGSPVGSASIYLKMDEGYQGTANNSGNRGSTLNGTLNNASWTNSGKFNKGVTLNGSTGSNVSIPDFAY